MNWISRLVHVYRKSVQNACQTLRPNTYELEKRGRPRKKPMQLQINEYFFRAKTHPFETAIRLREMTPSETCMLLSVKRRLTMNADYVLQHGMVE